MGFSFDRSFSEIRYAKFLENFAAVCQRPRWCKDLFLRERKIIKTADFGAASTVMRERSAV
jgi:hypothetical protein